MIFIFWNFVRLHFNLGLCEFGRIFFTSEFRHDDNNNLNHIFNLMLKYLKNKINFRYTCYWIILNLRAKKKTKILQIAQKLGLACSVGRSL